MNDKVLDVIKEQRYQKENGDWVLFTSAIDVYEAKLIADCFKKFPPKKTIEIGCAEGASSLIIMDELQATKGQHTIVDPFQTTDWESKGINLLKKFGYNNFRLIEKGSEIALPALLENGEKFDFAFIDGWHTFDHTLIDAFYLIRMLNVGGVLLIDDIQMPAINKVMRYIYNYPCMKYIGNSPGQPITASRKIFDGVKSAINVVSHILPNRWRTEIFNGSVLVSDKKLGLRTSMMAFQKVSEDVRVWNWWESF